MKVFVLFIVSFSSFCCTEKNVAQPVSAWEKIAKDVTIIRDHYGIPHIYGKTDADCVFGLMYAQCEDDFARVEMNYITMLGKTSEVIGENNIYEDLLIRMTIDSAGAVEDYKNSPLWLKQLLNAHADGINYYLYRHPEVKPAVLTRFEPWFPLMYTDGSISAIQTGGLNANDIRNFYETKDIAYRGLNGPMEKPSTPVSTLFNGQEQQSEFYKPVDVNYIEQLSELYNPASSNYKEQLSGSNGFAIAPSKSASGKAMLYINPHVTFYFRPEVHVISEEGMNVYGAVTWGQFFVYQGFNEHLGFMHTSSMADVADLYQEKN